MGTPIFHFLIFHNFPFWEAAPALSNNFSILFMFSRQMSSEKFPNRPPFPSFSLPKNRTEITQKVIIKNNSLGQSQEKAATWIIHLGVDLFYFSFIRNVRDPIQNTQKKKMKKMEKKWRKRRGSSPPPPTTTSLYSRRNCDFDIL